MNKKLATAKKFVAEHKVAIAIAATTAICVVAHVSVIKQHNNFLKEHNLLDAFYAPED
jgi:hypothetical protein